MQRSLSLVRFNFLLNHFHLQYLDTHGWWLLSLLDIFIQTFFLLFCSLQFSLCREENAIFFLLLPPFTLLLSSPLLVRSHSLSLCCAVLCKRRRKRIDFLCVPRFTLFVSFRPMWERVKASKHESEREKDTYYTQHSTAHEEKEENDSSLPLNNITTHIIFYTVSKQASRQANVSKDIADAEWGGFLLLLLLLLVMPMENSKIMLLEGVVVEFSISRGKKLVASHSTRERERYECDEEFQRRCLEEEKVSFLRWR